MRAYADFHRTFAGSTEGTTRVTLDRFGTLRDLCAAGVRLHEGMLMTLYADSDVNEDIEVDAVVVWMPASPWHEATWGGEYESDSFRYVVAPPGLAPGIFPCVQCGANLQEQISREGMSPAGTCPSCGTRIHAPLDPP